MKHIAITLLLVPRPQARLGPLGHPWWPQTHWWRAEPHVTTVHKNTTNIWLDYVPCGTQPLAARLATRVWIC